MEERRHPQAKKLLKDAKLIQSKLKTGGGKAKTSSEVAKLFARMIMHGKIGAAMKLLDKEGCTGGEYSCRCHGKRVISALSRPLTLKLAGHIL